jgi:hypothetical protein
VVKTADIQVVCLPENVTAQPHLSQLKSGVGTKTASSVASYLLSFFTEFLTVFISYVTVSGINLTLLIE